MQQHWETHMRGFKLLSLAMTALLAGAAAGAPAFADEAQPANPDGAATSDAPATPSTDAAPSDSPPASEEKPAE